MRVLGTSKALHDLRVDNQLHGIHTHYLVDRGEVADYADLARLTHVSRARISQIMNLTLLAPDIQGRPGSAHHPHAGVPASP